MMNEQVVILFVRLHFCSNLLQLSTVPLLTNPLMVSCTHHVLHTMARIALLAVILVISRNQQRSRVTKMEYGSQTTLHAKVNIQTSTDANIAAGGEII